jgi:hypothetical protein
MSPGVHSVKMGDSNIWNGIERINGRMHRLNISWSKKTSTRGNELMECLREASEFRFRQPLRDTSIHLSTMVKERKGEPDPIFIGDCVEALTLTGRGMVYVEELFEYLVSNRDALCGSQLATLIYECGRHGLRSKHFLDTIVKDKPQVRAASIHESNIPRALKGTCRFAGEYKPFVQACLGKIRGSTLLPEDVLVGLRALKQSHDGVGFKRLIREADWSRFNTAELMSGIYLLKRSRNFNLDHNAKRVVVAVIHGLVRQLAESVKSQLPPEVIVTDVSDCLDAMGSWRINQCQDLLKVLMDFLVSRSAEIKYSPICGLWQAITDSCGHLNYFHGPWMRIVDDMASSTFNLKSFAAFQLVFFLSSLGRLNFYSERTYSTIVSVISHDVHSINDVDMLATLLFPLERAGFKSPDLINQVLDQAHACLSGKNTANRSVNRGLLSIVYSAVSLGHDRADPRLHALFARALENLENSHRELNSMDHLRIERLVHLGLTDSSTMPEWVTCAPIDLREDGTVVVSENAEETMYTWAHPNDHKSFDLTPHRTDSHRELIRRCVEQQGYSKIDFIVSS